MGCSPSKLRFLPVGNHARGRQYIVICSPHDREQAPTKYMIDKLVHKVQRSLLGLESAILTDWKLVIMLRFVVDAVGARGGVDAFSRLLRNPTPRDVGCPCTPPCICRSPLSLFLLDLRKGHTWHDLISERRAATLPLLSLRVDIKNDQIMICALICGVVAFLLPFGRWLSVKYRTVTRTWGICEKHPNNADDMGP